MRALIQKDLKLLPMGKRIVGMIFFTWLTMAFFAFFFSNDMTENRILERMEVAVVDEEQSELSRMLIGSFHRNDAFSAMISIREGSKADMEALYRQGDLTALVVIPETFTTSLLHYENEPLEVWLNPEQPLKMTVFEQMLSSYSDYIRSVDAATYGLYTVLEESGMERDQLNQINDLFSVQMISTALGRNRMFAYDPVDTFPSATSGIYFFWSIQVALIMLLSVAVGTGVAQEQQNHCLSRYKTVSPRLIKPLLSKVLTGMLYQGVLLSVVILPLLFIPSIRQALTIKGILLMICTLAFFNSLAVMVGAWSKSQDGAVLVGTVGSFLLMLAGGHFLPLPLMPLFVQKLAAATPNYWILRALILSTSPSANYWTPVILLFFGGAFLLMGSTVLTRRLGGGLRG